MKRLVLLLVVGLIATLSVTAFGDDDFVITREKAGPGERHQPLKNTDILLADTIVIASISEPVNIYRIFVTGTAALSAIGIYDAADFTTAAVSTCAFEIYDATDGAGYYIDFGDDPIRLTTGFSVKLTNAYATIHYRGQEAD